MTYKASDRLEGWIDDQITENDNETLHESSFSQNNLDSYDDWIDNLDIDTSEEFNRMSKRKTKGNSTNERDLDPWI